MRFFFFLLLFFFHIETKHKIVYIAGIASLFFLVGLYTTAIVNDFYHIKSKERSLLTHSFGGEKYQQDLKDNTRENGYYLWENIAQKELEIAWNKKVNLVLTQKTKKINPLRQPFIGF